MAQFVSDLNRKIENSFTLYLSIDTATPLCCRFLQAGGSPEKVVELLSDNYTAVAQTVNLLAEWMIQAGVDIKDVQEMVENHLKEMILKTFDPKKADSIFSDEGEVYLPLRKLAHAIYRDFFSIKNWKKKMFEKF